MTVLLQPCLLSESDIEPVEVVNPDSGSPLILLCEHAGSAIPKALGTLGVDKSVMASHRASDLGAERLARRLAERLRAPLIIQQYSRLVIDSNRPPGTQGSIPEFSDDEPIHGNCNLSSEEKDFRRTEIFDPMDRAIEELFNIRPRRAAFSIHSFTPRFNGMTRPWHAGFLSRQNTETAERMRSIVKRSSPGSVVALNEPYRIDDETDWFIPVHVEPRGIAHCLIEVRNDQLASSEGASHWADLLEAAIRECVEVSAC